jgi:hypothetical protein
VTLNRLSDRWAYWLPFATIAAKRVSASIQFNPQLSPLTRLKLIHERTISRLLALGIPWATIIKHDLDDPRGSEAERDRIIGAAAERRQSRMGRVKGQVNSRYQRRLE